MELDALIAAMKETAKVKPFPVEVPGWGTVYVRALTVGEVEQQAADTADKSDKNRIAKGAARIICDEKGNRKFDASNPAHIDLLAAQPWPLLEKVLKASEQFNAISEEGSAEAKNG